MSGTRVRAGTGNGGEAGAVAGGGPEASAGASPGISPAGGEEPPRGRGESAGSGSAGSGSSGSVRSGSVAARFSVQNRQQSVPVDSAGLAAFLSRVAADAAPGDRRGATLRLLSDRRIRELNRRFRGMDAATDVLAFPAEPGDDPGDLGDPGSPDGPGGGEAPAGVGVGAAAGAAGFGEEPYLGDLAVSAETARRQAAARGQTLDRELRVLALHGYLHLLGYDHETDRGEMARLERLLRRRHGLAPGDGAAAAGAGAGAGSGRNRAAGAP